MSKVKIYTLIIIIISLFTGCDKNSNLSQLSVHIIDVGQGDSILIQTPTQKNILIDAGNEDSYHLIRSYLKKSKVQSLDMVIATHLDSDHIGSLDDIIANFNIKSIYTPEQAYDSDAYDNLLKSCSNKNLDIQYLYKGDIKKIDEHINLLVLSPSYIQDENNLNSIVLKLDYKNKSFLFMGDASSSNELDIIDSFKLEDIDFLKVGHHGSKTSTSLPFLNATTPDVAVISCGYKNQYGHPHRSVLDNLSSRDISTYRTDLVGNIVFYSDGNTIFTKKNYKYEQ